MNNKLLSTLNNKKTIFYGVIFGIVLSLTYSVIFYVPQYSTSIKLYVRNIPRSDVINEYGSGPTIQSESGFSNPLFNLQQILESQELASRVYKIVSKDYPQDLRILKVKSLKDWENIYSKAIKTKIEPSTDVITVYLNWPDEEHAAQILNITVSQFKNVNLGIRKAVEVKQSDYLEDQVKELGNKLDNIRRLIKEYKLNHRITDVDNESSELTKARVDLEKEKEQLKSEISYNSLKLTNLASLLKVPSATIALRATAIGDDNYLTKLKQDLAAAEQNYSKLQATYTDYYPDVIAAKNEIKHLNNIIDKRLKESLGDISVKRGIYDKSSQEIVVDMARSQAEKYSLNTRLGTLEKGIDYLHKKELTLPAKVFGLQELQKQEDALLDAYTTATQSLLEAKIKENEIVDNIVSLGTPASPSFLLNTILMKLTGFIILGIICSSGISWVRGDVDNKWINVEEIEKTTDFKILGVIPWLKNKAISIKDFMHVSGSLMDVVYGEIVSNIISRMSKENIQSVTFISTQPFRSRCLIVSNIAIILAKLKKSVILIDTNFLEPEKILKDLGVTLPSGGSDLLDAINSINRQLSINKSINKDILDKFIEDALVYVDTGNNGLGFYYLGASKRTDNIYEYVATQGFRELVNYLKNYYELILIETPPKSCIFPEFSVIAEISDASVIIAALSTGKTELIKVLERFQKLSNRILGVIAREENSEIEEYLKAQTSYRHSAKQYK